MNNTTKENELLKTDLLSVDCLNDGEGWSWNSWYKLEYGIWLHPDILFSPRKLLKYCRDHLGILSLESKGKVQIDDDGYNVSIQTRNGCTLFAFCYGEFL